MKDRRRVACALQGNLNDWVFSESSRRDEGADNASQQGREDAERFAETLEQIFAEAELAKRAG